MVELGRRNRAGYPKIWGMRRWLFFAIACSCVLAPANKCGRLRIIIGVCAALLDSISKSAKYLFQFTALCPTTVADGAETDWC